MASIVKKAGGKVYLAYIIRSPYGVWQEYADMYEEIFAVMSVQSLYDFVKNSEFDIIHCSSEPGSYDAGAYAFRQNSDP